MRILKVLAVLFFDFIDLFIHQKNIIRSLKKDFDQISSYIDVGAHKGTYLDLFQINNLLIKLIKILGTKIYENKFQISVIPHTLKFTNIIKLRVNNMVNIEFDVLGKYIKNFIK